MKEARVERVLVEEVRKLGGWAVKLAPTVAGLPDRLVLLPGGRVRFVELKTRGGRLSLIQGVIHRRLAELGHPVTVLWTTEEVRTWVGDLDG